MDKEKENDMKILFQGDSITDAKRNRADITDLGKGYPFYAAQNMEILYPDVDFDFFDIAYSGNEVIDLLNRLERDFLSIDADIISILVGINDVWHSPKRNIPPMDNGIFEERYRTLLSTLREKTNAKLIVLEPFLGPVEDKLCMRADLDSKIQIIRKLACEYADLYIPLDGLLAQAFVNDEHTKYMEDGVHPTPYGSEFIGQIYAKEIGKLL